MIEGIKRTLIFNYEPSRLLKKCSLYKMMMMVMTMPMPMTDNGNDNDKNNDNGNSNDNVSNHTRD